MAKFFVIHKEALNRLLANHEKGILDPTFDHGAKEFDSEPEAMQAALTLGNNWIVWSPMQRLGQSFNG